MPKTEKQFVCASCSSVSLKWQGRCSKCQTWNTLEEKQVFSQVPGKSKSTHSEPSKKLVSLSNIGAQQYKRLKTGFKEFDDVLGGGLVVGSLVLLGGDPGIGKSTLALESAVNIQALGSRVVYVAGEESPFQIKMREGRLNKSSSLDILPETNLETILASLSSIGAEVVIVDSIQTIYSDQSTGVTGGISQIVYITNAFMRFAKQTGTTIIIIGHVTKEGILAGPKTLEHMVDAVLYLEGERFGMLRVLRGIKNRFGSVGEVGVFEMTTEGLKEVTNTSGLFLDSASLGKAGSAVTCVVEGNNKAVLVEVQSLVNKTSFGYPKRTVSGFDASRLQLILAIVEKYLKLPMSNYDVFINVTGGFKLEERAADLPIALAVISSLKEYAMPSGMVAFGELGLTGEVRSVVQTQKRIKESFKLGFSSIYTGKSKDSSKTKPDPRIKTFAHIKDTLDLFT